MTKIHISLKRVVAISFSYPRNRSKKLLDSFIRPVVEKG